jgi:hypothetical protein
MLQEEEPAARLEDAIHLVQYLAYLLDAVDAVEASVVELNLFPTEEALHFPRV